MLKYLFTAYFSDGAFLSQPENDQSSINPQKSFFYDVLEKDKTTPLEIFCLTDGKNSYIVNLKDGSFDVNGAKFFQHDTEIPLQNFRLIFFRRHWHNFISHQENVGYFIGWQANKPNGENVKQTLTIF